MTIRPAAPEPLDPFEPHDLGCRCWPHVGQREAVEVSVDAARAEYLAAREARADERARHNAELRAAVEALISHSAGGYEYEWSCVPSEPPYEFMHEDCGDFEAHNHLVDRRAVLALLADPPS